MSFSWLFLVIGCPAGCQYLAHVAAQALKVRLADEIVACIHLAFEEVHRAVVFQYGEFIDIVQVGVGALDVADRRSVGVECLGDGDVRHLAPDFAAYEHFACGRPCREQQVVFRARVVRIEEIPRPHAHQGDKIGCRDVAQLCVDLR